MTTSGIVLTKNNASNLINIAFDYCQIAVEEEGLTAEDYQRAERSANQMLRSWQAQGFHLWQYTEGTVFLEKSKTCYPLYNDSTKFSRSDFVGSTKSITDVAPTLNRIVTTTPLIITCDGVRYGEVTNDLDGWIIGIDFSGTIFWTTITTYTVGTDATIDLASPTPTQSVEGQNVYVYAPESVQGVLSAERILDIRRVQSIGTNFETETPITFRSHQEYERLPNKRTLGVPNQATFDRMQQGGQIKLWQTTSNEATYQLRFTFERTFEKYVTTGDTSDFPTYWEDAFCWNLAARLAVQFRVPPDVKADIQIEAAKTLNEAQNYDNANYDMKVVINNRVGA